MADTIVNRCLGMEVEDPASSHSTKENILSQEVTSQVLPKMKLSACMTDDFTYDAAAATRGSEIVNLGISLESLCGIRAAKLNMFAVDYEQPNRLHVLRLSGPQCHASSGIVYYRCDDIMAAADADLLPIDHNAYRHLKTISASIMERSVKEAVADFKKFIDLTDSHGHADLMQLTDFSEGQLVPVSTSPFVRFLCICIYQLVTPPTGDPAAVAGTRWHRIDAMSEAFVYRPSCPRVESVYPMEFVFNPNPRESSNAPFNLVGVLSRKLIANYEELRGAKLVLTSTAGGTELPIDNEDVFVTAEQDRVNIDLRDCLAAACRFFPQLPDRFQARLCLLGVTGNRDWDSALTSADVIFVQQQPWQQQQPSPLPPPSKVQRRQRSYLEEDELQDDFKDVWM